MSDPRDPDDDLAALLADLDRTLGDLRDELEERESGGRNRNGRGDDRDGDRSEGADDRPARPRRDRGDRRGGPTARQAERYGYRRRERGDRSNADGRDRPLPRPPSLGEMLRFTEEYTIPTVISMLEATVRSLELLRSALRLVDPQRSTFDDGDRRRSTTERLAATTMGREALSGVDRAIDDLRDALSGLPEEGESRGIVTDARDLMGEIEARIDEAERERERSKYGYREREESGREHGNRRDRDRDGENGRGRREESRTIDVTDEDEEESPRVDVDAELASIRKEVRGDDGAEASDDGPEPDGTRDEDPGDGA
ncbi:hypothetical protein C474_19209 [Halogeometricum pallidum JCM 14848]|uniref:Uncharacterized protein n=1 Tax=Halogeometricum pallidum JCM 14848 TaxID=1227487 RepID=M0CXG3_HALPD|nr:hypothetical protein [Halogeometricum pallidum]ELZ26559.1 hypothetical protein C474_19209 [Halogeometricum pallidum JCM 14848]